MNLYTLGYTKEVSCQFIGKKWPQESIFILLYVFFSASAVHLMQPLLLWHNFGIINQSLMPSFKRSSKHLENLINSYRSSKLEG